MEHEFLSPRKPLLGRSPFKQQPDNLTPSPRKHINELSPRRTPRSPMIPPKTPPSWKKPDEVIKLHHLRRRQCLLFESKTESLSSSKPVNEYPSSTPPVKRKNPFKKNASNVEQLVKKQKQESPNKENSLFRLLGLTDPQFQHKDPLDFDSIIEKIKQQNIPKEKINVLNKVKSVPIDWTLRTKVRFMSKRPFPWSRTLNTCEEASGVTGFVRCLDLSATDTLDTSPNAMFHQCCLFWQHPSLPWLPLFPRNNLKKQETEKYPFSNLNIQVKEALHNDWSDSFRSVFQLVRARHCPYFYIVSNSFVCLFRAAGVNGCSETNAIIGPTTSGFRYLLRENDVEYTFPFKKIRKSTDNLGCEPLSEDSDKETDISIINNDEDDDEEAFNWLKSLGVADSEVGKIKITDSNIKINKERNKIEADNNTIIYVEGCEVQGLLNCLINSRTIIPTTGLLAGVPPTILSPIAFPGSTLVSLQVRESTINIEKEKFYSIELRGPILPHSVQNMCQLLKNSLDKFSVTLANLDTTKKFSEAIKQIISNENSDNSSKTPRTPGKAFSIESLNDSGLNNSLLSTFCSDDVKNYETLKYENSTYSIT